MEKDQSKEVSGNEETPEEVMIGNILHINIGDNKKPFYIPKPSEEFRKWMSNNARALMYKYKKDGSK